MSVWTFSFVVSFSSFTAAYFQAFVHFLPLNPSFRVNRGQRLVGGITYELQLEDHAIFYVPVRQNQQAALGCVVCF